MAGRKHLSKGNRDAGGFVALPWSVLDSAAFASLSHPARSLLLELARQYVRDNNGRLIASMAYLSKRGWNSYDVITRALRELMAAGFIHQTVKGRRPNRASWYAITWHPLDRHPEFDHGAVESFTRSAYRQGAIGGLVGARPTPSGGAAKNAILKPSDGVGGPSIAPPHGVGHPTTTPPDGAMEANFGTLSTPSGGDHLEKPSTPGIPSACTAVDSAPPAARQLRPASPVVRASATAPAQLS